MTDMITFEQLEHLDPTAASVGALTGPSSPDFLVEVRATEDAIDSLATDINHLAATLPLDDPRAGDLLRLQVEYLNFQQEFAGWAAFENSPAGDTDTGALKQYQARYTAYRSRFVAVGGAPTSNLPTSLFQPSTWPWYLWAGVAAAGFLVVGPYVAGPLLGASLLGRR